jgi:hypothetical protein
MTVKITLITPPDIFENDNKSLLFLNLSEEQQTAVTDWLRNFNSDENLNIYFYQGEINIPWILHAMGVSHYKYINIDQSNELTGLLLGYILGKANVYFSTDDQNVASVFGYINSNRIRSVTDFLERTLSGKE